MSIEQNKNKKPLSNKQLLVLINNLKDISDTHGRIIDMIIDKLDRKEKERIKLLKKLF